MKKKLFLGRTMQFFICCIFFFLSDVGLSAQTTATIQGQVLDATTQEPLIGVSVLEKSTSNGTITDMDGNFSLKVAPTSTLVFSYIGYSPIEVKADKARGIIKLREDTKTLDEVVVVGYGTQKKVNMTGAVSAVKIDESMASRSVSNVSSGLSGLVPGLVVSQSTGFAGGNGASLQVRGLGSINDSNPLIVVDGMPDVDINRIDMNDIESISVLKDAASSAVYGSRAANGVILITTKNGMGTTKPKISYTGSYAISETSNFYDYLPDYARAMTMHMRASASGNKSSGFREGSAEQWMAMSMVDPILFPNTDQFKDAFRTGSLFNQNVSASGSTDQMNFYVSVGVMDEKGLQLNNNYSRYNIRANIDYKIRKNFKIGFKTDGQWSDRSYPRGNGFENAGMKYAVSGVLNQHPETGEYGGAMAYGENLSAGNVLAEYNAYRTDVSRKEYNGNIYAEWEPLKDLKINISYALRYYSSFRKEVQNPIDQWNFQMGVIDRTIPDNNGDRLVNENLEGHKTMFQGRINYDKEIFSGHKLGLLFVAAEEYWFDRQLYASRTDRLHPSLSELDAALQNQLNGGYSMEEGLRSFIGRVNYTMYDRYLFEFNCRTDGSSKFVKGNQYGFFPSGAIGWRISEEAFFAPLKNAVSNAKFRASLGTLGNNSGDVIKRRDYEQSETLATTNYILNGSIVKGFSNNKMINEDLSWESTRVINIGLDLGFFNNKLTAELDWYDRFTSGMIRGSSVSNLLSGYSAPRVNIADLQNRGIEANITWRDKIGKDFSYSINANGSYNQNTLKEWGDYQNKGWEYLDMPWRFLYMYDAYSGLTQSWNQIYNAPYQAQYAAPGDILLKDVNGDGKISGEDKVAHTDKLRQSPLGQFGFTLSAQFKGFDFQALFQGSYGRWDVWLDDYNNVNVSADRYAFQKLHWNDTWSLDNRNASLPRITTGDAGKNREESGFWAQQTSYLRMKNLQLGYSIPTILLKKISFDRARIFVSAENLFTLTGWKGIDPEKNHDWDAYPTVKTYSIGLNVEF